MIISILGCGWLGLPLAEQLRDEGHHIKGSTTSPEKLTLLKGKNIEPYLIRLDPRLNADADPDFWDADLLILNIPPGRNREHVEQFHKQQIQAIIENIRDSSIDEVIFVSSTSVYPEQPGIVAEEDAKAGEAVRPSGNALLKAEALLMNESSFDTHIVRFGGLYGYDRHPVTHLSGRKNLSNGNAPVNLIHRDDCIGILKAIIHSNISNHIFNGVSDGHPPKKMYYPAVARAKGLAPPVYNDDENEGYKIVSNMKLKHMLNYTFKYPNPMDF
ncbi:SDR family oxidoreductase [Fodinibius sediminis]|uniref:Nucleoside-diphosphate-sugar epimerase n=1 Tax=Fodinibius sediminis TaxID=1214077 RepID=A0A521DE72_9BACT|nr:SDR family oxidoreductase [Fodinibius sediminis]SMO70027.1 Nucleoside-diphosphate-sugar epimerase [Fodinibius sediminis]